MLLVLLVPRRRQKDPTARLSIATPAAAVEGTPQAVGFTTPVLRRSLVDARTIRRHARQPNIVSRSRQTFVRSAKTANRDPGSTLYGRTTPRTALGTGRNSPCIALPWPGRQAGGQADGWMVESASGHSDSSGEPRQPDREHGKRWTQNKLWR